MYSAMEQAKYCRMWSQREKNSLISSTSHHLHESTTHPLCGDSWEEQAFAEDAAGPHGGCIWPPRSYSCSFCRREFRSAQALGGHMNVHRRDRARLKQSPISDHPHHHDDNHGVLENPRYHHQQHRHQNLQIQYPSQICTMVYNPNPKSDHVVFPSQPRVSLPPPPKENNFDEKTFVIPLSSSPVLDQEKHHNSSSTCAPPSWSNFVVADRYFHVPESFGFNSRAEEDYVATDLSVSLNLVVRRTLPSSCGGKEELINGKKRKIDSAPFLFFPKSSSGYGSDHLQSEVLSSSSAEEQEEEEKEEELDLELRLGDRPEVM